MLPAIDLSTKAVTLVLGGAQSGKSFYALQLASQFKRVTFIATARRTDVEMRRKIDGHRRARPVTWKTIESPLHLDRAILSEASNADVLLIDCVTIYVANVMGQRKKSKYNANEHMDALCAAIRISKASVIVVSNEVGSGVVPPYRSGRLYRDFLGQTNRKLAQIADNVILMVAGLPVFVKGTVAGSSDRFCRPVDFAIKEFAMPANATASRD